MRCVDLDICSRCIEWTPKGYVCPQCVAQGDDGCLVCGKFAVFKCVSCVKLRSIKPNPCLRRTCRGRFLVFSGFLGDSDYHFVANAVDIDVSDLVARKMVKNEEKYPHLQARLSLSIGVQIYLLMELCGEEDEGEHKKEYEEQK